MSVRDPRAPLADRVWLAGSVIGREVNGEPEGHRYVVQVEDGRRFVALRGDVRHWTLSFDFLESFEKMAS